MKNADAVRAEYLEAFREFLINRGEDVLLVKSGTLCIPWAREKDEGYLTVTLSIPKGSRDGEPYNGYEEAKNYQLENKVKIEKKNEITQKKEAKIKRDKALREAKAKVKADLETK